MVKCVFCGREISVGSGFVFVRKSGQALNFCSRKCQRNLSLGRNPKKLKWAGGA